ncbi:MAG TPA: ABC transporter substrate-binding protein [Chloroflexota bacterium]|nr:ABC transporter substrate-binding protein [Chloroflexota bacterium]
MGRRIGRRAFLAGLGALSGAWAAGCRRRAAISRAPLPPGASPAPTPPPAVEPPPVPNAAQAQRYQGVQLTYYGDSVGIGAELDQQLGARFTQDTGIAVRVIPRPQSASEAYATYLRFFQARSAAIDVLLIDIIWPGAFAPHLLDLRPFCAGEIDQFYPALIANNTVADRLVALPWFADVGLLYYRVDLLERYGFAAPPATWEELEVQARRIVAGERAANPVFTGYVFQGNAYEGLTCNALEWLASVGGGRILERGRVTIANPAAAAILDQARGWVGLIAPRGVTTYQEDDARNVFQAGNAAFMRNWPYAYALAAGPASRVAGRFGVAPLPAAPGQPRVGTAGGQQLAVCQYSRAPEAAVELVRYLTSAPVQVYRALRGSFLPTRPAVAADPRVLAAEPFLGPLQAVERVTRPARDAGARYNQVSTAFFQGVNQVLNGADAVQLLPRVARRIERALA